MKSIDFGGYCGNPTLWAPVNGANSSIYFSQNGKNWINVGVLPQNYGQAIQKINFDVRNKIITKFIQFRNKGYLGIGYLKIYSIDGKESLENDDIITILPSQKIPKTSLSLPTKSITNNAINVNKSNTKSNKQLVKVKTGKIIIKSAFTSGGFVYNNKIVGSNFLNELNDPLLSKGNIL